MTFKNLYRIDLDQKLLIRPREQLKQGTELKSYIRKKRKWSTLCGFVYIALEDSVVAAAGIGGVESAVLTD